MNENADQWYSLTDEERNKFLKQSADDYAQKKADLKRKVRRPTPQKIKVLDPASGELMELTTQEANDFAKQYKIEEAEKRKLANEQKNSNFIQLQKGTAPEMIAEIVSISPIAVQVLMFFFKNMSKEGVLAVSQQTIADTLGKSRQAVNQAVKVLENHHAVARGKIGGSSVVYIVNPDIAWQQTSIKKQTMYMHGVMMLSKSENERIFEEFSKLSKKSKEMSPLTIKTGTVRVARNHAMTEKFVSDDTATGHEELVTPEPYEEMYDEHDEDDYLPPGERPPEGY